MAVCSRSPRAAWIVHCLLVWVVVFGCPTTGRGQAPAKVVLGNAEPLSSMPYSFNTTLLTAIAFYGFNHDGPQMEQAVRTLRPSGLRFPGGTLANNYRWTEDSFSDPTNDKTVWAGEQIRLFRKIGRRYDLPGFARLCKRFNVAPIWVLNIYEETPESVVGLLKHLDALGIKLHAIEMGNEPYWDGRSFNHVQNYINYCRPLAAALKQYQPEIKIGACFAPLGIDANYEGIWNTPLAQEKWFDAIVFHDYYGGQGFALEKGSKVPSAALLKPEAMIDAPVAAFAKLLPGKPIWFTEWNIGVEGLDQWKNTGAEIQFIAVTLARMIEHRDVIALACYHDIYDDRFGAFYFDAKAGEVKTNASWQLFRLFGTAFAGATHLRPVSFEGQDLPGFATEGEDGARLFVVNRGSTAQSIALSSDFRGDISQQIIHCSPEVALPMSTPLIQPGEIEGGIATLPPYSVSLIGPRSTLAFEPKSVAEDNLFPRRPDLVFWYPPHAVQQPRFDVNGEYVVDMNQCRGKPLAVIKMTLAHLKLMPHRMYQIDFEAKADAECGVVLKLPEIDTAKKERGDGRDIFMPIQKVFTPQRAVFQYAPDANSGDITFVLTKERIEQAGGLAFRGFRISLAD